MDLIPDATCLIIDTAVEIPLQFNFNDFASIPVEEQIADISKFHPGHNGAAVGLRSLLWIARPLSAANHVTLHADRDDFLVSIPLDLQRNRGTIVYKVDMLPLRTDLGAPIRFLIRELGSSHSAELDDCRNVM